MPRPLPGALADLAPVWVAPMAGGPSTPRLVVAAARAGTLAQLAAGYRTPDGVAAQIDEVRRAAVATFGVNVFVPNPRPVDPASYRRYRDSLARTAESFGVVALPDAIEDDDHWSAKLALLREDPVPVVSFTFGLPPREAVRVLRRSGSILLQTVTSVTEARAAEEAGVDALVVQGFGAGGHSGIFDPAALPADRPLDELVSEVSARVGLPIVAAGGIADARSVSAALAAGASAVAVGTAVLRSPEAGTAEVHRRALADPALDRTALTRAFTGRPARALVNRFVVEHDAQAPAGYPAVHHLTRPIRTASTAAGDPSAVNLWAGTAWRAAADAPLAGTLARMVPA